MYVVLMAMLALNVSTEVLEGFAVVEESLNRTTDNSSRENVSIYRQLSEQFKSNPEKVQAWFDKATTVKRMSDSLYDFAQQLKENIVKEADGPDGNVFDSSYKRNPQTTSFRCNQVIKGWTEALTMMPVGSKWEIYIPQELAYGERQAGQIQPYSTLIFTVELISIEKASDASKK